MKTKTVKLVALRNIYYDGDRVEGEEFEAQEEHVNPLLITKAAMLATEGKNKSGHYNRRDMRAAEDQSS